MTDNIIKLVPTSVGEDTHLDCDEMLEAAKGNASQLAIVYIPKDAQTLRDIHVCGSDSIDSAYRLLGLAMRYLDELDG